MKPIRPEREVSVNLVRSKESRGKCKTSKDHRWKRREHELREQKRHETNMMKYEQLRFSFLSV